jgi:hypothetical protein
VKRGYTFTEILVALGISIAMAGVVLAAWRSLFNQGSRHSAIGITRSSFSQKDAKAGVRRLMYRLREAIQILTPLPGKSGDTLQFQDITNASVRFRLDAAARRVVSEVLRGQQWVTETAPEELVVGGKVSTASWPVTMPNCTALRFTTVSPECAAVEATVEADGQPRQVVTVVKLRNSNIAY